MKKILLALTMAIIGGLYTVPAPAAEISVVAQPNPIDIPEVIIVSVLLICALWKSGWIRIILCLGVIIWGIFFMPYDAKVAAPLLGVGVILFIREAMTLYRNMRRVPE